MTTYSLRRSHSATNSSFLSWRLRFNRKNRFERLTSDDWAVAAPKRAMHTPKQAPTTFTIGGYVVGAEADPFLVGHPDIRY